METSQNLPFKVGQRAESKSFLKGFRGAWFRCEILKSRFKHGKLGHSLNYFDFPDEKEKYEQLYKKAPAGVSGQEREQLMLRPSFPPIYHENKMPDLSTISEVIAIVDDVRKVGDLVDWWMDSCYWSGRITQILDKDKVQIELAEPPMGEGGSYEASLKDLRPSLDWSPEHGWTVPESKDNETCRYCAHLVQPVIRDEGNNDGIPTMEASCELTAASVTSHGSDGSLPPLEFSSHPSVSEMERQQPSGSRLNEETRETPLEFSSHPLVSEMQKQQPSGSSLNKEARETPLEFSSHPSVSEIQRQQPSGSSLNEKAREAPLEFSSHPSVSEMQKQRPSASSLNEETREKPLDFSSHPSVSEMQKQQPSGSSLNEEARETPYTNTDDSMEKTSFSDSVSSSHDKDALSATGRTTGRDRYSYSASSKKMKTSENQLNSTCSDTIESSILDLEELVNRVKWLRGALDVGFHFANQMKPSWKFLENRSCMTD